ncbi:NAD(P)/FAD-dependent oxidoreductase [Thermovenabulum gondwanense]|uniref:L-2-hydroxyglutarate oxidase LhgO n=1 Tax=Thermovenabulum gondwanense TaxID=520767 RepID=A0A161QAI9_9FIRM|nr:NAD(P)/FAD-dependent oxidoreductase [Thermovenabulum gondwanense]KYO65474.1 L-2-hydroxyglutarate oxidase LhgO [Thermovenabulum gondwanense]
MKDVVIIGGGVVGTAIAYELGKYNLDVVLLEKGDDVASGTTKANSAIIHAGYDAKPGTLKAKLNVRGNFLFSKICEELDVPFKRIGSLVLAFNDEEIKEIENLLERGKINGIPQIEIIGKEDILKMEPNVNKEVKAALFAKTAGIICPYELAQAFGENAFLNGVEFKFNSPVIGIEKLKDGFIVKTTHEDIHARFIINAAGVYADEIARMANAEEYKIIPRKGEYLLFDKSVGNIVNKVLFPTPTKISKGILVSPTVDGNFFIGPNSNNQESKEDTSVTLEGIEEIIKGAQRLVPNIPLKSVITSFAGIRAVAETDDFVINASQKVKGFINAGGIQSPGLSAAPAIAEMVIEILKDEGLQLNYKQNYICGRPKKFRFRELTNEQRKKLIEENPDFGHIVCRCETVTKAEIIDAIRRPLGAKSLDAVKRRTRAGMGRCQGGFCSPRIAEILSKELNIEQTQVTKFGPGSEILKGRVKEFEIEGGGHLAE